MTFLQELRRDYKLTFEAWKEAYAKGDKEAMEKHSNDLVRIADKLEGER